jgi:outer membrane receptor for ferrienterochelin and colicins
VKTHHPVLGALFALQAGTAGATPDERDAPAAATATATPEVIEEVRVVGVRDRLYQNGLLKDVIQKTEIIDDQVIAGRQAVNLTRAIEQSPGVRVSNECSMCGVKRVMLNGLRGEHTTILTDGVPLHTMLAGFYALDALPTMGVARVEVARGAGASLIAPEAIGGTVNVISREPSSTFFDMNLSVTAVKDGIDAGYLAGAQGGYVSDDERLRASLVAQFDEQGQVDGDDNGVSEAPRLENENVVGRVSYDLTDRDNLVLRAAFTDAEIFGGPTAATRIGAVLAGFDGIESDPLFTGDDVRAPYTGKPWETTEWITSERRELSGSWLREFSADFNGAVTVAWSEHEQGSFYEGFDYRATDDLLYADLRGNYALNERHLLTFGVDLRDERMRSASVAGAASENYIEDSFDYTLRGLYLQNTWTPGDSLELALAVRIDQVRADFVAEEKPGTEIDETVIAPRLDLRYLHGDRWTSRLSAGIGYRAPLSFFETDHGILDAGDGFAIDIDALETSNSVTYALSFEGERFSATASVAYTRVEDLASLDETEDGVPLLTQAEDSARVIASDLALGYALTDWLTLGATIEDFNYDDTFRESFGVAPVTQRLVLTGDLDWNGWDVYATASYVGSRDLTDFGYEGFNILDDATSVKDTDAEAFWTVDLRIERDVNDRLSVYLGALNLFDYTQVREGETPLFWDADGGYDVAYNWGPLRGREVYAGVQLHF